MSGPRPDRQSSSSGIWRNLLAAHEECLMCSFVKITDLFCSREINRQKTRWLEKWGAFPLALLFILLFFFFSFQCPPWWSEVRTTVIFSFLNFNLRIQLAPKQVKGAPKEAGRKGKETAELSRFAIEIQFILKKEWILLSCWMWPFHFKWHVGLFATRCCCCCC